MGQLALLRVGRLVVGGQRPQVGEGARAQLAGEGDGFVAMLHLVLGQVPRILEGPLAVRAVERPLARVGELVSFDVRRAGECLAACFAGVAIWSDLRLKLRLRRGGFLLAVRLLCAALSCTALGEKFNGGEDLVRARRA